MWAGNYFKARTRNILPFFAPPGPAPSARGRRPLSCFALREPSACKRPVPSPRLASLRRSGSPAVCLRGSTSLRLPWPNAKSRALSCFAASRALSVSLCNSGSLHASPPALRLSPLGLRKPFRRRFALPLVLLRGLRSHLRRLLAALGALRSPRAFFCHSRTRLCGHRLRR